MRTIPTLRQATFAAICATIAPTAAMSEVPETLILKSVPHDVYLTVHTTATTEDDFIEEKWAGVWDQVVESGVIDEAMTTVASFGGADAAEMTQMGDHVRGLVMSVDWATLADREYLYTMRLNKDSLHIEERAEGVSINGGSPEMVTILRGSNSAENFEAIKKIVTELAGMTGGQVVLSETPKAIGGYSVLELTDGVSDRALLTLGHSGDSIAIAITGAKLFEQMATNSGTSLISTRRFKSAFDKLPTPETEMVFFDASRMTDGLEEVFEAVMKAAEPHFGEDEASQIAMVKDLVGRALGEVRTFDYVATVGHVEGRKQIKSEVTHINSSRDGIVSRLLNSTTPLDDPLQYIPSNAANFSASAGIDPNVLYQEIRKLVDEFNPGGLAQFDQIMASSPVNLEQDLLSWIAGGQISMSMSGPGSSNSAMLLRVKDEAKAQASVGKILDTVNMILESRRQGTFSRTPSSLGEGFEQVTHPQMAMMMITPVIGTSNGFYMLGTSPNALKTVMDTKAGTVDSIRTNDKLMNTMPDLKGETLSVSWKDLSNFGQETAMALSMGSMMGGMALAGQPDAPPQVGKLLGLLNKVAPIVSNINFLDSQTTLATRDGNYRMKTKVTVYKDN